MAIDRVEIKDFLVFKGEFAVDFCPGVNVIIGDNGSGKTTLMKVIYSACSFDRESLKSLDVYERSRDFSRVFSNYFSVKPGSYDIKVVTSGQELCTMKDRHCFFSSGDYPRINAFFIPVTNILAHSEGMLELNAKFKIPFDQTEIDAFVNAGLPDAQKVLGANQYLLEQISSVIQGEVVNLNGVYYVKKSNNELVEFALEADGFSKFGLLWKLLRNGLVEPGSILFWDEPEASINPELMPTLVDILLELQRGGVQVFVAMHSDILAGYFNVNRQKGDSVMFYSLYRENDTVKSNSNERFDLLEPNKLTDEPLKLYEKELERVFGNE